jgi:hypothetical protein
MDNHEAVNIQDDNQNLKVNPIDRDELNESHLSSLFTNDNNQEIGETNI